MIATSVQTYSDLKETADYSQDVTCTSSDRVKSKGRFAIHDSQPAKTKDTPDQKLID